MATTIYDVARLAGVSPGTVSNVVNERPHVSEATRSRVLEAVGKLGYRANSSARTLRSGRTGIITVAIPELRLPSHADFTARIAREAERYGWSVLIEQTYADPDREMAALTGERRRLDDGLVLTQPLRTVLRRWTRPSSYPVVVLGNVDLSLGVDCVSHDGVAASELATAHLLDIGRRKVAYIGPLEPREGYVAHRIEGHRRALAAAGLIQDPRLVVEASGLHRDQAEVAMNELIDRGHPFDAVRCFNDSTALGVLTALRTRGVMVPDDVAVIGYDDIEEARYSAPPLSTVAIGRPETVRLAVETLHDRMMGRLDEPVHHVVAHELRARASTGGAGDGQGD